MSNTADDVVLVELAHQVATVTLNRPESFNSWNLAMQTQFFEVLDELALNDEVRSVVLTGAGRAFCSGADMSMLSEGDGETSTSSRPLLAPIWFPKPIVAAVNGACAGIGLLLALICDVRFGAEDAKFTTAFSRIGLVAEHGLSWLLPRLTSLATASELLISGRIIDGVEAEKRGLIHFSLERDELLSRAQEYALDLAENVSPTAMAVIKWQMYNHQERQFLDTLDHSDVLMKEAGSRPDFAEGLAAFAEKRRPQFAHLDVSAVPRMSFTSKE